MEGDFSKNYGPSVKSPTVRFLMIAMGWNRPRHDFRLLRQRGELSDDLGCVFLVVQEVENEPLEFVENRI
jgi:hypothetical protein